MVGYKKMNKVVLRREDFEIEFSSDTSMTFLDMGMDEHAECVEFLYFD